MLTCGQIPDIVVGIAHDQTVSNRAFDYSGGVEKTLSAHRHERHIAQPEHLTFDIQAPFLAGSQPLRSEEHTSELQSLMRISYAVFCLKKKNSKQRHTPTYQTETDIQHQ